MYVVFAYFIIEKKIILKLLITYSISYDLFTFYAVRNEYNNENFCFLPFVRHLVY